MKRASRSLRFVFLARPCWGMWSRFTDQHLASVDPAGQCLHLDSLAHAGPHWDVASHGRCGNREKEWHEHVCGRWSISNAIQL
jgi:hypothetical protein